MEEEEIKILKQAIDLGQVAVKYLDMIKDLYVRWTLADSLGILSEETKQMLSELEDIMKSEVEPDTEDSFGLYQLAQLAQEVCVDPTRGAWPGDD